MERRVMNEMTPARWERIQDLFHAARRRADVDRARFLDEACAGDDLLRSEVQALLVQPVSTGSFVDFIGGPAPPQLDEQARVTLAGRRRPRRPAWPRCRDQSVAAGLHR
jgi:serine/threonine-protein kinase